ncbi:MAG: hypothetical protein ACYDDF_08760 [Thermoplasmatota archaeon]
MTQPAGRSLFLVFALLGVLGVLAAAATTNVSAAGNASNSSNSTNASPQADYVVTIHGAPGTTTQFVPANLIFPAGAKVQLVYNSTGTGLPHDVQLFKSDGTTGLGIGTKKAINPGTGNFATPVFTIPSDGLTYICSVHGAAMTGHIVAGAFVEGGGSGGPVTITSQGIHVLAYWIGVISFAVLFLMYGVSFFLFKHGETPHTTDHKDRPDYEERRTIMGMPEYVFVVLAILILAAAVVLLFKIFLSGF